MALMVSDMELIPGQRRSIVSVERTPLIYSIHPRTNTRTLHLPHKIQISKEGDLFEVPISVAKMSALVETTIDDEDDDDDDEENGGGGAEIPLPNVKGAVLAKVIEYCTHYTNVEEMTAISTPLKSSKIEEVVQQWYADFVKVEQVMLFELVTAANFMDIKPLLDLTCFAVAVLIKGKSAEEIRKIFNISSDFTPEDEAQVREENKWCEKP